MQPQSEKNIVQRFLEWWRGRPGADSGSNGTTSPGPTEPPAKSTDSNSGTKDSIAANAREYAGGLKNQATDLADKSREAASDVSTTAAKLRDQVLDTSESLQNAFPETDKDDVPASNTDDTVRLNDLAASQMTSNPVARPEEVDPATDGSQGMRSLYQGSRSTGSSAEAPAGEDSIAGAPDTNPELDLSDAASIPDLGGGAEEEPAALTEITPGDPQVDLSGTIYDRSDEESTFRDLSAADSLASGSYADEEIIESSDSDLEGIGNLNAEELGTLEDIESETSAPDMGDEFDLGSTSDSYAESDRVQLAGSHDDERDAFGDEADGNIPTAGILVEEDEFTNPDWDNVAAAAPDSASSATDDSDQAAELVGTTDASETARMQNAPESELTPDENITMAADTGTAHESHSSTTGTDSQNQGDSSSVGGNSESPRHFGFLGYDNTETTDLSYLNQATARRFTFETTPTESQVSSSAGEPPAQTRDEDQGEASDRFDLDEPTPQESAYVRSDAATKTKHDDAALHATTTGDTTGSAREESGTGGSIRGDKSGSCPANYPIKGNGSSRIYHMPGIPSYRGTKAEICFATEADAIAAGFRAPGGRNHSSTSTTPAPANSTSELENAVVTHTDPAMPAASSGGSSTPTSHSGSATSSSVHEASSSPLPDSETGRGQDHDDQSPDDSASTEVADNSAIEMPEVEESHTNKGAGTERHIAGAVPGDGSHSCPAEYPIKGNAGSMIFHAPGRASYDATIPEWCFATEQDALNAGFRAPKR